MTNMTPLTSITHVIFDVDGLLLDTESLYSKIMQSVLDPFGHKFTWDVKVKQMGKKQQDAGQVLIDEYKLPITVKDYVSKVNELSEVYFPQTDLMPGAERLIRHLERHNIPMALATGSYEREYQLKITKHRDLFKVFKHTVCGSDDPEVKNGKPAPDIFLIAASRFPDKPASEKVLVFEDAPNGVQGALAARMPVVWVPDSHVNTSGLDKEVSILLRSLNDFKPEMFSLPPFDQNA